MTQFVYDLNNVVLGLAQLCRFERMLAERVNETACNARVVLARFVDCTESSLGEWDRVRRRAVGQVAALREEVVANLRRERDEPQRAATSSLPRARKRSPRRRRQRVQ